MSRDARFDQLEAEIVAALRRAPGVEPSADLDARIRARAHAAVASSARRTQPRWLAVAAGLMVLVGSGLALRIMQQVDRAPSPLDEPVQSVPAPAAIESPKRAAVATEADQAAGEALDEAELARPQAASPVLIPDVITAPAVVIDVPSADKLSTPVGELAAPPAESPSSATASPDQVVTSEYSRMRRESPKPFPGAIDAQSGPASAPPAPVTVAPMTAPEPTTVPGKMPAPAAPPPPPIAADDGYARESVAGDTAMSADAPASPRQEEFKTRAEPFEARDRDAQPGADPSPARRADAEVRPNARQLDERAAAGALASPPRATGVQAAPGLASQAAAPSQEFEAVDTATAARRAADYELRLDAIHKALERGERKQARELAAALERDFPEATLPRALRRQLAR